jgi:hypothetical protein
MMHAASVARDSADPIGVLALLLAEDRPLLAWAVEFASHEDPLPGAWSRCRDPLAMSVVLALASPRSFLDAMKSIPSARYPNAIGDTLQVLAFLPDAVRARMLAPLVRDAGRMLNRLSGPHRELLTRSVCDALRRAAPSVTFDSVLESVSGHARNSRSP